MSELGQFLKEAREKKQLSLEDLQRTTKIQKRYLQAIEDGRFDDLPGLFYARAFVKTYAETVDLTPEEVFEQFKNELPNPQQDAIVLPSRTERIKENEPIVQAKKRSILPALIGVIVIIAVIALIWKFAQGNGSEKPIVPTDDEPNIETEVGEVDQDEGEQAEQPDVEPGDQGQEDANDIDDEADETPNNNESLTLVRSEGNTSYYDLQGGHFKEVRIALTGPSYVDIKNSAGDTLYSGQPAEGEVTFEDLEAETSLLFNFGASQNVKLFIGNTEVEFPLDIIHQKISVTITDGE